MSFYRGRYAELYDLFYADKPYADEARFVYDRLTQHAGQAPRRVLELACGTGNHAIALGKLGVEVTATDVSEDLLTVARAKGQRLSSTATFTACDMTRIPAPAEPFDAAICMFDSIGYVQTDANLAKVFMGVNASLKPGGLFLFEFWHAPAMRRNFDPLRVRKLKTPDSTVIRLSETSLDRARSLARVNYDLFELRGDGTYTHFEEAQTNRFFDLAEMEAFASPSGFRPLAAYAGFERDAAVTDDTWHVISVWQTDADGALGDTR